MLIQLSLAACASLIMPLTTPMMMADFSVGGMLLVATGLRICRDSKVFAVVNITPRPAAAGNADFGRVDGLFADDACFLRQSGDRLCSLLRNL